MRQREFSGQAVFLIPLRAGDPSALTLPQSFFGTIEYALATTRAPRFRRFTRQDTAMLTRMVLPSVACITPTVMDQIIRFVRSGIRDWPTT